LVGAAFVAASPYIVTYSVTTLHVWSLLSCTLCWSLQMPVAALAVDPVSSQFAILVNTASSPAAKNARDGVPSSRPRSSVVVVFHPGAVQPTGVHVLPPASPATSLVYLVGSSPGGDKGQEGMLVVLDKDRAVWTTRAEPPPEVRDRCCQSACAAERRLPNNRELTRLPELPLPSCRLQSRPPNKRRPRQALIGCLGQPQQTRTPHHPQLRFRVVP